MPKNVIAILPGNKLDHIAVDDALDSVCFSGEKGSTLTLPIETYLFNNKEYFIARYSDLVEPDEIEKAIKTYY